MKCKTCGADMRLTKTLTFKTGPLRLVFECKGRIVHAAVHDMQQDQDDDLLLKAAGKAGTPSLSWSSPTREIASR